MAITTKPLADYPGFGVCYDPSKKPFFEMTILEDLAKLASKPLSSGLLAAIGRATPENRRVSRTLSSDLHGIIFSQGINVMCIPTTMTFIQSGYKRDGFYGDSGFVTTGLSKSTSKQHNPDGCAFYAAGGSCAMAADPGYSGDGRGTVSIMKYTNAQVFSQGSGARESTYPHIVLAHELIHSLHHLTGTRNEKGQEEQWTTGIGEFADEPLSENKIREEFGLALRMAY